MQLLTSVQRSEKGLQVLHSSFLFLVMFAAPSVPTTSSPLIILPIKYKTTSFANAG